MARYRTEPAFAHGTPALTGVLIANLGTPEAPTAGALRSYLRQFLWDPRVVEIPRPAWWLILNALILNVRPAKSAAKYAQIWTEQGSPLMVHTQRQAELLATDLAKAGHPEVCVAYAMRYGNPAIPEVLEGMRAQGCRRILVVPLYPQYAASAAASVIDEVARCLLAWRNQPEMRFVRSFFDDPGYIASLAASVHRHWERNGRAERLVMSFHGVPRFTLERGDPYHCECHKTARLLARELALESGQWQLTFQSRFGKAEWLQPYTQPTLEEFARAGVRSVDLLCPGFVADCLETLEEIGMECRQAFLSNGGESFSLIPCLNGDPEWIDALGRLVRAHLGNWLQHGTPDPDVLAESAARARALGATR